MSLNGKKNLSPMLKQDKNALINQKQNEREVILAKREQDVEKREVIITKREQDVEKREVAITKRE